MDIQTFFESFPQSYKIYLVVNEVIEALGPSSVQITKSQIRYSTSHHFAYLWIPGRYQKGRVAPLVLSIPLPYVDETVDWKEVVEVRSAVYMHHKELWTSSDLDCHVVHTLRSAYSGESHAR
ncbi:hypothetical protein SDC9_136262 [bioreactor metagenome]|uniref:DUF5655 domain-containing protein n=1 Tax=bioreactor metagenome TaxID=1076179 RepID=A0A645DI34_9ZZZZ|nr:hypothetical protein [Sphaerochaeta sp.]